MNIFWFRTDLRVKDNTGLFEALKSDKTLCLFIIDTILINRETINENRTQFMLSSLQKLSNELGNKLVIKKGRPEEILKELISTGKFNSLCFNKDYTPYSIKRDEKVIKIVRDKGIKVFTYKDSVIFEEREILNKEGNSFKVFTAYKNAWIEKYNSQKYILKNPNLKNLSTENIKSDIYLGDLLISTFLKPAGTIASEKRWEIFRENALSKYNLNRDRLDIDGTSRMSAYIKFGNISIRYLVNDLFEYISENRDADGAKTYLSELIWREFYKMILFNFPNVSRESFQDKFKKIKWENNESYINAWKEGRTGYPIVDAAMKQLQKEGWMHNRARMIVSSFLCKDLLVDWRIGEEHFKKYLIDYDQASNNGGWQWSAGVGTDAAPYFRILNPSTQSEKFDPEGKYIKTYIPDLKDIPSKFLHDPEILKKTGKYIDPIVTHIVQREKALKLYLV